MKKNKASLSFYALGSPEKNVSSPCAFGALTCVLFMQCFNFPSQGWQPAITTCEHHKLV